MEVDLGCGGNKKEGCIGYDCREMSGVDIIGDIRELKFRDDMVDKFYCSHVIEHFIKEDVVKIFREVFRCLKSGGEFEVRCPNFDEYYKIYVRGEWDMEQMNMQIFGNPYDGNKVHFHKMGFDRKMLEKLFIEAGFTGIQSDLSNIHELRFKGFK